MLTAGPGAGGALYAADSTVFTRNVAFESNGAVNASVTEAELPGSGGSFLAINSNVTIVGGTATASTALGGSGGFAYLSASLLDLVDAVHLIGNRCGAG